MRDLSNRAYREQVASGAEDKPWVYAVRRVLSEAHPRPDYCDLIVLANVGLGQGVYPIDQVPDEHPHGLCRDEEVIDKGFFASGERPLQFELTDEMVEASERLGWDGDLGRAASAVGTRADVAAMADEFSVDGRVPLARVPLDQASPYGYDPGGTIDDVALRRGA